MLCGSAKRAVHWRRRPRLCPGLGETALDWSPGWRKKTTTREQKTEREKKMSSELASSSPSLFFYFFFLEVRGRKKTRSLARLSLLFSRVHSSFSFDGHVSCDLDSMDERSNDCQPAREIRDGVFSFFFNRRSQQPPPLLLLPTTPTTIRFFVARSPVSSSFSAHLLLH